MPALQPKTILKTSSPEDVAEQIVSEPSDPYHLGKHRLYCGSCLSNESYELLMNGDEAQMVITDPPYNVKDYRACHWQRRCPA